MRHNYRFGVYAENLFIHRYTTRWQQSKASCYKLLLRVLQPSLKMRSASAVCTFKLQFEQGNNTKPYIYLVIKVLKEDGYILPPTAYQNNLQHNVHLV